MSILIRTLTNTLSMDLAYNSAAAATDAERSGCVGRIRTVTICGSVITVGLRLGFGLGLGLR